MTRVFDVDGTERSLTWLAQTYDGCVVLPAKIGNAKEVWRLQAIFCTEGPALVKAEVRGKNNMPVDNQPVVMTWPSLDSPGNEPTFDNLTGYDNRWADRGVVKRTASDGMHGLGLGSAYGPWYHLWVLSSAPSDCLSGTGMKGGTNHRGPLHGVWQLEDVEPIFGKLDDALVWHGQRKQVIEFNPGAALQKRIFADGFVPNSGEFKVQWTGQDYTAQRAEHLSSGEVRVYYVRSDDWNNVRYVVRK